MLTFRFRQTRSDDLPWLIELAKRGTFKAHGLGHKQTIYETTFDLLDPIQLGHALSMATALVYDKKAEVFTQGRALTMVTVREVLRCFQQSQQSDDPHAYCWFRTSFSFDLTVTEFTIDHSSKALIFPCRQAANRVYGIHPKQVGTIEEQVTAALLRAGTQWCPRLADLTDWRAANEVSPRSGA